MAEKRLSARRERLKRIALRRYFRKYMQSAEWQRWGKDALSRALERRLVELKKLGVIQ